MIWCRWYLRASVCPQEYAERAHEPALWRPSLRVHRVPASFQAAQELTGAPLRGGPRSRGSVPVRGVRTSLHQPQGPGAAPHPSRVVGGQGQRAARQTLPVRRLRQGLPQQVPAQSPPDHALGREALRVSRLSQAFRSQENPSGISWFLEKILL